jgi:hypothetical protein
MPGTMTLLRALVAAKHWQRFETFAGQFRRAALELAEAQNEPGLAKITVSARQYERWIYGDLKTEPWPDASRILEYMFGYPVRQLLAPADRLVPDTEPQVMSLDGSRNAGSEESEAPGTSPARIWTPGREAGRLSYYSSDEMPVPSDMGRVLAMAANRALRFGATADATNIGDSSLEQIHGELARLALAYPQESVTGIIGDIVSIQDHIFTLLEGRQKPRQARDLYFAGALASGLVAKAAHDYGDSRMAMTHARTALLCAENSEHTSLIAWVRGLQSLIAYWANAPRDALNYAQIGGSVHGVQGTSAIWLASLEARAWSVLGNGSASRAAIEKAVELREIVAVDDLDSMGGICFFSRARQLYYAADAGAMLWRLHSASLVLPEDSHAADAVAAYESAPADERAFGDESGARTDLAIAHISQGSLDGAWEAIQPVLELPVSQRIHGIVGSILNVHHAAGAAASDAPLTRDIQEAIEGYISTPVAALPR